MIWQLGRSGSLVGFNVVMSAEDLKSKSKTLTEARDISIPLTVPAHEGRVVSVKTTIASTDTFHEASLRAEGTVGIEVNPGWWRPNEFQQHLFRILKCTSKKLHYAWFFFD
jgi:hypothetical protein